MQLAGFSPSLSQLNQLSNALSQHPSVLAPLSPSMSAMSSSLASMSSSNVAASLYQTYQTHQTHQTHQTSPSSLASATHQSRSHHQPAGLSTLSNDFSNRQLHPLTSGVNTSGVNASGAQGGSDHMDKSQGLNCYNGYEHLLLNGSNYFQDCLTSHSRSSSSVVGSVARNHIHHTPHSHHPHHALLMAGHVPHGGDKESNSPSVYENNNLNELSPTI